MLEKISKTALKTRFKTKLNFGFRKTPCELLPKSFKKHSKGIFNVYGRFTEDYLRSQKPTKIEKI
jgi:hypothetical protein